MKQNSDGSLTLYFQNKSGPRQGIQLGADADRRVLALHSRLLAERRDFNGSWVPPSANKVD